MAEIDDDIEVDVESKKTGSGKLKSILIISAIGLLVVGISITATWFIMSSGDKSSDGSTDSEEATESSESNNNGRDKKTSEAEMEAKKNALSKAQAMYLDLLPAFVVNLESDSDVRYLQVEVSIMIHSNEDIELVKLHMPVVRHHLMLLFSGQEFSVLKTMEGKEKLQADALSVIQKVMKDVTGYPVVKAVYLPSIVGQ